MSVDVQEYNDNSTGYNEIIIDTVDVLLLFLFIKKAENRIPQFT
jgi:hypothetical protein